MWGWCPAPLSGHSWISAGHCMVSGQLRWKASGHISSFPGEEAQAKWCWDQNNLEVGGRPRTGGTRSRPLRSGLDCGIRQVASPLLVKGEFARLTAAAERKQSG